DRGRRTRRVADGASGRHTSSGWVASPVRRIVLKNEVEGLKPSVCSYVIENPLFVSYPPLNPLKFWTFLGLVRKRGFEPLRYCYRQPLKLVRLPVPPLPRTEGSIWSGQKPDLLRCVGGCARRRGRSRRRRCRRGRRSGRR